MSRTINECIMHSKIVREYLSGRTPLRFDTNTLIESRDDNNVILDSYELWYLATCDTLSFFEDSPIFPDWRRWINSITSISVVDLASMLKDAAHRLVAMDYCSYETFKQSLAIDYPFSGEILSPVRKVMDRWWRYYDTTALTYLYSWLLFISHVHLHDVKGLEEAAIRDYLSLEETLQDDGFSVEESRVIEEWFPRSIENMFFFSEDHVPEHGNGSTADSGKSAIRKYLGLFEDPRLHMLCSRIHDNPYPRPPIIVKDDQLRCSKTIFVPKTLTKHRTISMEPASIMWHQKGVRRSLLRFIRERKHYLRRRYTPEAQEPNRDLAWEGSIDGSFATIDLSSASDSVSWALVRKWFGNSVLYPWLLWTRSTRTVLPTGQVLKLKKYAPMGSDLCFPIECIVFSAITECAIREAGSNPKASRFRVYGDDIVVEDEFAQVVIDRLERNGFCVNRSKTFFGCQARGFFRESCGGFYFNGVDISPIRISRKFSGLDMYREGRVQPEVVQRLIDFANECSARYPLVRHYLVSLLLELPKRQRPIFSEDGTRGLFSKQPTNFHLYSEDAPHYCATYLLHGDVSPNYGKWDLGWEDIRLFEYLKATRFRSSLTWPEDRVNVNLRPVTSNSWITKRRIIYR